jgi:hypothetical protein
MYFKMISPDGRYAKKRTIAITAYKHISIRDIHVRDAKTLSGKPGWYANILGMESKQ